MRVKGVVLSERPHNGCGFSRSASQPWGSELESVWCLYVFSPRPSPLQRHASFEGGHASCAASCYLRRQYFFTCGRSTSYTALQCADQCMWRMHWKHRLTQTHSPSKLYQPTTSRDAWWSITYCTTTRIFPQGSASVALGFSVRRVANLTLHSVSKVWEQLI